MKLNKTKCRRGEIKKLVVIIPRAASNKLPDFFFADVEITNIQKRQKEGGKIKKCLI